MDKHYRRDAATITANLQHHNARFSGKSILLTGGAGFLGTQFSHYFMYLNEEKIIVEALQNNIFMKMGNVISTPPVSQGCVNGVMRKQVLAILSKMEGYQVIETNISPFDLQKADELFLTNVISGIQPITQYRKKTYAIDFSTAVVAQLNVSLQLN